MLYLSRFFLDYCVGYLRVLRLVLAKSNLVLFERYFRDLLVDLRRYRYGRPKWFASMLSRLDLQLDLVVLLDASADSILRRNPNCRMKGSNDNETPGQELGFKCTKPVFVKTNVDIDESVSAPAASVTEYMKWRCDERFRG